jgi:hypothetical protein
MKVDTTVNDKIVFVAARNYSLRNLNFENFRKCPVVSSRLFGSPFVLQ